MKVKLWKNTELKGYIDVGEDFEQAAYVLNALKNLCEDFNNMIVTSITLESKDDDAMFKIIIDND